MRTRFNNNFCAGPEHPEHAQRFAAKCAEVARLLEFGSRRREAFAASGMPKQAVVVRGERYESVNAAARALGMDDGTLRRWAARRLNGCRFAEDKA